MNVLYVALPIAIAMGAAAMWACVRSIRAGQFDDLDGPPVRMLLDDQPNPPSEPTSEQDDSIDRD